MGKVIDVVIAGEAICTAVKGTPVSEHNQAIIKAVVGVIDEVMPSIERHLTFDLAGVLNGVAASLNGIAEAIEAGKRQKAA